MNVAVGQTCPTCGEVKQFDATARARLAVATLRRLGRDEGMALRGQAATDRAAVHMLEGFILAAFEDGKKAASP